MLHDVFSIPTLFLSIFADDFFCLHLQVPLMSKIDRSIIEKAPFLNLIMQFGVGLEGVDIEAATELGIAVR